jgi:uncharacterized protein (TIGR03790 family)
MPVTLNLRWAIGLFLCCGLAVRLQAGGSGLNVVVVVNQNSTNSVQLGNYYCEKRQVPPQNLLRVNWAGGNLQWFQSDFESVLLNPLLSMLAARQLTNQIDYVLLSMDLPYQTVSPANAYNSTTSTLFYGFKPDTDPPCSLDPTSTNLYAATEGIFRLTPPISPASNSFLVTMITASNLPSAMQIIDSGVGSDFTFPTQTVFLAKSGDVDRNVRYVEFDNAIFNARLRGGYSLQRTNASGPAGLGTLLGFQGGAYSYPVPGSTFVPGALADNLTSYGGLILTDNAGQLSILSLLAAGAAGSYGTVTEPCNYLEKFPSPLDYFYQARGFSLAECYYQSLISPYQGLLIGEPLAAPFACPAAGAWINLPTNALLSGSTNLSLQFNAADPSRPLQQVDLFLDGTWLRTLTNLPPQSNNILYVTLNGYTTNYALPGGATLLLAASNLTACLNDPSYSNLTKVGAVAYGDRIELKSVEPGKAGAQVSLSVTNSIGAAPLLDTFIMASGTNFLDTVAYGIRNFLVWDTNANYPPPPGSWLQLAVTKTNGTVVAITATNSATVTNVAQLVSSLISQLNAHPQLASADGCTAEDFIDYMDYDPTTHAAEFNLRALSPGWDAAQINVVLTGSSTNDFVITPGGSNRLDGNLSDLQPRAHLYITAGVTNLPLTFLFDTTTVANGFHDLTVVAYEGSHVRTQARLTQTIQIQNGPLAANFVTLVGASNSAVEGTLQFSVTANTNTISSIELFSTGGSLGIISNAPSAVFSVAGTNLDLGLHPFYAIITASNGQQYRTETKWIRLIGPENPFVLSISNPPPTLSWPATAGRSYDILSATALANPFQPSATLIPPSTAALWTETNPPAAQRFYRVRTSQ